VAADDHATDRPAGDAALPDFAERVLAVVDLIPPGRVLSYGDIAEWIGSRSPRQVGRVMFRFGSAVPWHRVVMSDGAPAPNHAREQLALLRADGTPLVADGSRVDMRRARWDGC
jgi:alkylated DNA nucleotide flippase Atl1